MPEFIPPPTPIEDMYNIEQAQEFLESVGQFDEVRSNLARDLLNLRHVWPYIDRSLATTVDSTEAASERVYSGLSGAGDYFEVYGFPIEFEDRATVYTGNLVFHTDLATGQTSTLRPDMFYDSVSMQLRFTPGPGAVDAIANKLTKDMGHARLTIGTALKMPPEDFNYTRQGIRQVLLDTEIFQRRTGLYREVLRTCIYQPDPAYYNTTPPDEYEDFVHVDI